MVRMVKTRRRKRNKSCKEGEDILTYTSAEITEGSFEIIYEKDYQVLLEKISSSEHSK